MYVFNNSDHTKGRIYVVDLDESSNDCPFVYSDFTVTQLMMNGIEYTPTDLGYVSFIRVNNTLYMSRDTKDSDYTYHYFRVDPITGAVDTTSSTFVHRQDVQYISTNNFGKIGIFETYDNLYWMSQYSEDYYQVAGLHLPSGYLASINNLQNAINKTADRTLKVTYTLTYA
jgi:hypothetical protein